ncbi:MAG: GntR family transcriptional regulator [Rhodospirillaceae bacterium]|nr:GntR family transcriptional regulator [Rhodospirillaceae bacterium]
MKSGAAGTRALPALDSSPIDRRSPLPLYVQINRSLIPLIANWPHPERRFYTDQELCALFDVSRMTARAALADMIDQGLLRRRPGSGTFVNIKKIEEHFSPEMDFLDQWATKGRPLSIEIRRFELAPLPAKVAPLLGIAAGTECLYIERLRRAGPVPISLDFRYIVAKVGRHLRLADVQDRSLLDVIRTQVELSHGEFTVEAAPAEIAHTEMLELLPGDPVMVRSLVYTDVAGKPVMAGHSVYRADQTRYTLRVPLRRADAEAPSGRKQNGAGEWGTVVQMRQEFRRDASRRYTDEIDKVRRGGSS